MKFKKIFASVAAICSLIAGKISAVGINGIKHFEDGRKSVFVSKEKIPEFKIA